MEKLKKQEDIILNFLSEKNITAIHLKIFDEFYSVLNIGYGYVSVNEGKPPELLTVPLSQWIFSFLNLDSDVERYIEPTDNGKTLNLYLGLSKIRLGYITKFTTKIIKSEKIIREAVNIKLPKGWERTPHPTFGVCYVRVKDELSVLSTLEKHYEGDIWLHTSLSKRNSLPSWRDLKEVKDIFYKDGRAFQILPPKNEYVNLHKYTLHLWGCLTKDVLPEINSY